MNPQWSRTSGPEIVTRLEEIVDHRGHKARDTERIAIGYNRKIDKL